MRRTLVYIALVAMLGAMFVVDSSAIPIYLQDNVLVGANFNDGPGSSDMTLIMRIETDGEAWLDEGHDVKFITNPDNGDIEDGWTQVEYDDSDWEDGISGVGFADGDDNTITAGGLISIWTRYYFDISDADSIGELRFLVEYDDQFAAWLNGELIKASAGVAATIGDDEPAFDLSSGGVPNHGSQELQAGKPNKNRWDNGGQEQVDIEFEFSGASALSVEARGKVSTVWGRLKASR